jgi:hypothetical protein
MRSVPSTLASSRALWPSLSAQQDGKAKRAALYSLLGILDHCVLNDWLIGWLVVGLRLVVWLCVSVGVGWLVLG